MRGGGFSWQFGGTMRTDARGEFMIDGLVPGWPYELNVVLGKAPDGSPRGWRTVHTVTPEKAEEVSLGVITLPSDKP